MSCEQALELPPPVSPEINKKILVVAAALIDQDGRVLCTQRPKGKWLEGQWEFPGGKVEEEEIPEFALMRELREELGIETRPSCFTPLSFISHIYEDKGVHVLMPLYACRFWDGVPQGKEGQSMKWVFPKDMPNMDFVEADKQLFSVLRDYIS